MQILIYLFQRSKGVVLLASLAGVLSGACHVVLLSLVSNAAARASATTAVLLIYAALCVVMPLTRVVSQVLLAYLSQGVIFDLRLRLCRQVLGAPLRVLEVTGMPRLMASLTDDVMVIGSAFTIFPILCTHITVLFVSLAYLGYVSPMVLGLTLAMLVIGVFGFRLFISRAVKALGIARKTQDAMMGHFHALTGAIKELKLHRGRRTGFLSQILHLTASEYRTQNIIGVGFFAGAASWGQLVFFSLVGLVAFLLPMFGLIPREALVPSLLVILYIVSPIDVLSSNLPTLGRARIALEAIEKLGLSLEEQSSEREAADAGPVEWARIDMLGVTHTYQREGDSRNFTLGPIDLRFEPGELVFLVGGNGSGKTSLAKLITGLYAPESGAVLLDGAQVTNESRDRFRQLFSVVFSEAFLFDSLLGLDQPQLDARAAHYLTVLRLENNVTVTDGKLSTISLSQGQRKRLALLTAYLEDRPIYIFDEWAADQDPVFKRVFYHELLPELQSRGKTVIVISHDDAYYGAADRIIKLDEGKVQFDKRVGDAGYHTPAGVSGANA